MKSIFSKNQTDLLIHQKPLSARMWRYRYVYLMLLPALVWFVIFKYIPLYGITLAFKDYQYDKGIFGSPWVGFRYFKQFFNYFEFWTLIKNTIVISSMKLVIGFPVPIIFAIMLNEVRSTKYKRVLQTVSYLPHFVSWVVVLSLFTTLFSPNDGLVNELLGKWFGMEPIYFLGESKYFHAIVVGTSIWKEVGWNSIIYLAAITSIDVQLYEAAYLDGANKRQSMWHITIPGILPTIGIILLMNISSLVAAGFDQIYLFQTPGTLDVSEVLDTYVVKTGIEQGFFSYATAIGFFQSLVALLLMVTANTISKKVSDVSLW